MHLVDAVYSFSENFGKNTFNFFSSLRNELTESLFCDISNIVSYCFNYSGCNFSCLINSVSANISKIIPGNKPGKLSFSFRSSNMPPFLFCFFLFCQRIFKILIFWFNHKETERLVFLITMLSTNDLFNISIHKRCFP